MTSENHKRLKNVPPAARIGLALSLLRTLPEEAVQDIMERLARPADDREEGAHGPRIEVLDTPSTLMAGLMAGMASIREPERRAATPAEVLHLNRALVPPLKVGDRVRWRAGMRNASWPADGEECVVSQVIAPPLRQTDELTSTQAAWCNDIALAFMTPEGDASSIQEFIYDSRRFERVGGSVRKKVETPPVLQKALKPHLEVA